MTEVWKDVKNYEGLYQISNLGNVKRISSGKRLKPYNRKGYIRVALSKDDTTKHIDIHRLVAQAFIPNPENKPEVNHKDENKLNNEVSNLEWVTRKENIKHSIKTGTAYQNVHGSIKNKRCKKVAQYDLDGNLLRIWNSTREPEHILGYAHNNIRNACLKGWNNYGYKWKYIEESVETIPDECKEVE